MESKISNWVFAIEQLAMVTKHKHLQAAFAGCMHVMPRISALFAPVEEALLATFLPALFGGDDVDGHLRALNCLPVKFSGLGIPDPVPSTPNNLQNSQVACSLLIFALQTRS